MSASTALKQDILEQQHQLDRLTRLVDAKHEELNQVNADIRREQARLEKIKSQIRLIKSNYGVHT